MVVAVAHPVLVAWDVRVAMTTNVHQTSVKADQAAKPVNSNQYFVKPSAVKTAGGFFVVFPWYQLLWTASTLNRSI